MEVFLGSICAFGFNFAPYQWATCEGQVLPIQQYTALYSLIGTKFGGNGTTTFALPNLTGVSAIGQAPSYVIGQRGGNTNAILAPNNLPAHNHGISVALKANNTRSTVGDPVNNYPGPSSASGVKLYAATKTGVLGGAINITLSHTGSTSPAPFSILNPSLVSNYCIALYGNFPPRQ
jgi:microcystin-dependent protein